MNESVQLVKYGDKEIYLVKTAHVSKTSVEDVKQCIEEVKPDAICIELDEDRYKRLEDKDAYRDQDIVKVIKEKKVGFLLVNIILSSFQRKIAKSLGSETGGEMMEGIKQSKELNIPLVLADRPIRTTFSRIWNKLNLSEKIKLLSTIISSMFDNEEISEEEIANLKQSDALEAALNEISKEFPIMKKILVDERDQYLSTKIKNDFDLKELEDTTKKKGIGSIIKWLIPALIIFMVVYTLFTNKEVGLEQIKTWVLWNGTLSAIGTALALGHPLSILTAFVMAPITSLNPLLAAGWFAGLVEAIIRKPKVKDFEDLAIDTATLKGFWKNRVTKILLVVVFANIFSSIATFVSGAEILASFINLFK